MNIEKIKELYKTGDWILLTPSVITSYWIIVESPIWNCDNYKLIHKKHKHILDACLDGCEIYWKDLVQNTYGIDKKFIEDYEDTWADELWEYEAIPKTLENCYCEANDLHFCKLVDNGYSFNNTLKAAREIDKEEFIKIEDDKKVYYINSNSVGEKKIKFNEQLNNWTYCPYEGKVKNKMKQEASDGEKMRNNFKDYGFEADFEGEILKQVDNYLYGIVKYFTGKFIPIMWDIKNGKQCEVWTSKVYNLTPIKKEWYKDKDNLNKAFYDIVTKNIVIISWLDFKGNVRVLGDINTYSYDRFRPATTNEVDSLYYNYNNERKQ